MKTREWTEADVKALGVRTDFETACNVLGFGRTKGSQMLQAGELPFQVLRIGRKIVVPTAQLRKLLGLHDEAAA